MIVLKGIETGLRRLPALHRLSVRYLRPPPRASDLPCRYCSSQPARSPAAYPHNFTELLAGRTIQGMGGGGIMALVVVIFQRHHPSSTTAQGLESRSNPRGLLGTVAGPLVGGVFAQHAFLETGLQYQLPLLRPESGRRATWSSSSKLGEAPSEKNASTSLIGSEGFIFVAGFTGFLMGLTWGGVQWRTC